MFKYCIICYSMCVVNTILCFLFTKNLKNNLAILAISILVFLFCICLGILILDNTNLQI